MFYIRLVKVSSKTKQSNKHEILYSLQLETISCGQDGCVTSLVLLLFSYFYPSWIVLLKLPYEYVYQNFYIIDNTFLHPLLSGASLLNLKANQ